MVHVAPLRFRLLLGSRISCIAGRAHVRSSNRWLPWQPRLRAFATGDPQKLRLAFGASNHGEDHCDAAYFASHALGGFGIADGTGDLIKGEDSSLFSRSCLEYARDELSKTALAIRKPNLPLALRKAHEVASGTHHSGSCAVLLGLLHQDMLNILMLGDCGILVMRPWELQPMFFGGTTERTMRRVYRYVPLPSHASPLLSSRDEAAAMAEGCDQVSIQLRRGDIVLAGCRKLFERFGEKELQGMTIEHRARGSAASTVVAPGLAADISNSVAAAASLRDLQGTAAVLVAEAVAWTPVASGEVLQNFDGVR